MRMVLSFTALLVLTMEVPAAESRQLGRHDGRVKVLAFTPDGRSLISAAADGTAVIWDVASGAEQRRTRFQAAGAERHDPSPVALAPAGLRLAVVCPSRWGVPDTKLDVWDLATGTKVRTIQDVHWIPFLVALSPDGRMLALSHLKGDRSSRRWNTIVWDATSGRQLTAIDDPSLYRRWGYNSGAFALSDNGRLWSGPVIKAMPMHPPVQTLHVPSGDVYCWDAAHAQELGRHGSSVLTAGLTANGRVLAGRALAPDDSAMGAPVEIVVIETASGLERARFGRRPGIMRGGIRPYLASGALTPDAASADGSLVAEAQLAATGNAIVLWDAAAGREIHRFASPVKVRALAFSPDRRTLASGGEDGTIQLWDTGSCIPPLRPLSADDFDRAWASFAENDAPAAFRALLHLQATPTAVSRLRERLKPAVAIPSRQVALWVRDLDSDRFADRQRATSELRRAGRAAVPALRAALAGTPSVELKQRAAALIEEIAIAIPTGARLRELRAVELLEAWGTDDARTVLAELARGDPEADLTREAKATLERLAWRAPARPD